MRFSVRYTEGSLFAVPLTGGGFAVGVVSRAHRSGIVLGHFFGPRRWAVPSLDRIEGIRPSDAVLVGMFGDPSLLSGEWPILGVLAPWDRVQWSVPYFVRFEELTGRTFRVIYDQDDLSVLVREEEVKPGEDVSGPKDSLMGPGFVEDKLAMLLPPTA